MIHKLSIAILAAALLAACEPKPQPIHYGSDECAYCRMMITEPEFASQMLTRQGRAVKFDSIECMAAYDQTAEGVRDVHSHWVPNFLNAEEWLSAEEAYFLHSKTLRSPMGLYLSAYKDQTKAIEQQSEYKGRILQWNDIKKVVHDAWITDDPK